MRVRQLAEAPADTLQRCVASPASQPGDDFLLAQPIRLRGLEPASGFACIRCARRPSQASHQR
jgi:hypothetical protein